MLFSFTSFNNKRYAKRKKEEKTQDVYSQAQEETEKEQT